MGLKEGLLLITLLVGSYAAPRPKGQDMSIFFNHVNPEARIVGGSPAVQERQTHMVALVIGEGVRGYFCGGSLVSARAVLTAAHCIESVYFINSLFSTVGGVVGSMRWDEGGTLISFQRNVTHPHYVESVIKNDIGFLITSSDVSLSDVVSLIPLNYDYQEPGVPVRVAGWGKIGTYEGVSRVLLELSLAIVDPEQCGEDIATIGPEFGYNVPHVEPHIELCTFHSPNSGLCNGDSGSPLVREDDGTQIGVVSWGIPCANGAPDVFARISAYKDFIEKNIQ